jgi:hypothetical protein
LDKYQNSIKMKHMEVLPIGSITIFTNISDRQQSLFDTNLNQKVSDTIVNWIKNDFENKFPEATVIILSYETKIGCIITPILIGIIVKTAATAGAGAAVGTGLTIAAVGGAGYKFITDYDKVKKNLSAITNDIKNLWLKITHRKKKQDSKAAEREIEIYKDMPDELKKYYTSGKDVVIISEKETKTYHKVCVMREDIKEEITKETVEKEVRTINLKPAKERS